MKFTDIFIKRPVLATVISLLILLFGLKAIMSLSVRQFPKIENTTITINTTYPGASAKLMQGFITAPIEKAVASSEGIDYITAMSVQSKSSIKVHVRLNFDPNKAFTDVMAKVAQVTNQLPKEANKPVITKDTGSQVSLMYISFDSKIMSPEQITDYITRVVQPKIETIAGVASADILGAKNFAMRIWLNPAKMTQFGVTPADVKQALSQNSVQTSAGQIRGGYVLLNITAHTDLHNADDFKNLVVRSKGHTLVRLKDVAKVELGSANYNSDVTFNGKSAIFVGIQATPTANPLTTIEAVRNHLPAIEAAFPSSLKTKVVYDATEYISASIHEVIKTIFEATMIVILVIFLFLGAPRAVIIPIVTIPLSLVGVATLMLALGYSLNLLTLLAMVLAIGLVVDDAIVVVENIHRHLEEGLSPVDAALKGAREIAVPIITMTLTLAAVYAPIGFMGGITGALFKEFAFTLACSVIISGIIALTLSPMMCSKLINHHTLSTPLCQKIDAQFNRFKAVYQRWLTVVLENKSAVVLSAIVILCSCGYLYTHTKAELAPQEDESALFSFASGPQSANLNYMNLYAKQMNNIFAKIPEVSDYFTVTGFGGMNTGISGIMLKPWQERSRGQEAIKVQLQKQLRNVAGTNVVVFAIPPLPGTGGGLPIQFILTSTASYQTLYHSMEKLEKKARKSGLFFYLTSSLKFNNPQVDINIDREKAASLGINMTQINQAISSSYGGGFSNRFSLSGQSYEVIPQLGRAFRWLPEQINQTYVRTKSDQLIPLSTIVSLSYHITPNELTQFQQLNSATLKGILSPGVTMGQGLDFLRTTAEKTLPRTISFDYSGQSRQFMTEGDALVATFFFSLIVIFLVLSAQFESFRDPCIILIAVPMSICGALIPLNLGLATINIYTQIGLITLIGLISKHGILMVEFANQLKHAGKDKLTAIIEAASTRLRPILMTTAAMVLGVVPLLIATGAGAKSRFDIGLVIAAGMLIGTCFTLFVVPTMYLLISQELKLSSRVEHDE